MVLALEACLLDYNFLERISLIARKASSGGRSPMEMNRQNNVGIDGHDRNVGDNCQLAERIEHLTIRTEQLSAFGKPSREFDELVAK